MGDESVAIGTAASMFGLATSTLRYWEDRGLLTPAQRHGRFRRYGPADLHRIGLIQMWRDAGTMSLDGIAEVLAGTTRDTSWRHAVAERIAHIDQQQRRLAAARTHLEHLLSCPDESPAEQCPYLREAVRERMSGRLTTPEQLIADG